jgi:hypothetical protein
MQTPFFIIFSFVGDAEVGLESNKIATCKMECEQCLHSKMRGSMFDRKIEYRKKTLCVFGLAVEKIDFDRIDFKRIEFS